MTAREPSAVEVIAEALRVHSSVRGAEAALAALKAAGFVVATRDEIRAWSPIEQAELIGGRVWTAKPGSTCGQVRGPWRVVRS